MSANSGSPSAPVDRLVGPVSLREMGKWQTGWPPKPGYYFFRLNWWRPHQFDFVECDDSRVMRLMVPTRQWCSVDDFREHLDRNEVQFIGPIVS